MNNKVHLVLLMLLYSLVRIKSHRIYINGNNVRLPRTKRFIFDYSQIRVDRKVLVSFD